MENLGKITAFFIIIILGLFLGLLKTYIIMDISILYNIEFIKELTFIQVLGITYIIGIITLKGKNINNEKDENKSTSEVLLENLGTVFTLLFSYLLIWGFCYLMYKAIN